MEMTLEHPIHGCALTRVQLSGRTRPRCGICTGQVHGAAYICRRCDFFLHEPCALVEFPLQIADHPMHPEHPLVFRRKRMYSCDRCSFSVPEGVAIATLPPLEDAEGTMHHAGHEHTLYAFHVKVPNWIICHGCGEGIPGPAYGCLKCGFFLHESCARLPEEMLQHPFHPEHRLHLGCKSDYIFPCKACHTKVLDNLLYSCEECDFKLDFRCAALLLCLQDQEKEARVGIDHFSHKHQLLSSHVEESEHTRLRCAVCELQISGEAYYCPGCIFFLHKQCADELVQDMAHYLHTEHRLILQQEPPYESGTFGCNCCGMIYSGMVFHCASCEFDLDPRCALQTLSASRDGAAVKIKHFNHEDPLILHYAKQAAKSDARCKACYKEGTGLVYRCDKCDYVLHKSCADVALQLVHPLHPSHPLVLLTDAPDKPHRCDNCRSRFKGFRFYCTECVFYLCFECASKRSTLKHQLHEHILSYFERSPAEDNVNCNYCGENCTSDLYGCTPCNFNLHWECLPLPPTIEHECHPYHPLVLFDRFVEGLSEYQYCDYCEELRNPDRGVYRCAREECWYTVHIGCVLPHVRQNENTYYDDKLRKDIASLKETIEKREKELDALKEILSRLDIESGSERAKT